MDGREDVDVAARIRAQAGAAVVPPMSLEAAAVRAAGRRRLRTYRLGVGAGAAAAITAVAFGVGAAGGLWTAGDPVPPAGDAGAPTLQLRLVESSIEGACGAAPLQGDVAGAACDLAGTTTFELGSALGEVRPSAVQLVEPARVQLSFDADDAATVADATRAAVGQRLAMVVEGRVLSEAQVMEAITAGEILLVLDNADDAQQVMTTLGG
jgi:hypothetical protein